METLRWEILAPSIGSSFPVLMPMGGSKGVQIGYDPTTHLLVVRVPVPSQTRAPTTSFADLTIRLSESAGHTFLEIGTTEPGLYRELHRFAGLLTEDLEQSDARVVDVLSAALARWKELTAERSSLSADQQIGLLGEATLLAALVEAHGTSIVLAWSAGEMERRARHDFELPDLDVEVKSTRSNARIHVIHGLHQLTPAPKRPLYLLSLKFEPSGAAPGVSLQEKVEAVRCALASDENASKAFDVRLASAGYRDTEAELYRNRFRFADLPRLIAVNEECPRIDGVVLGKGLSAPLLAAISDVTYRINVEGLGVAQGSAEFASTLPLIRL